MKQARRSQLDTFCRQAFDLLDAAGVRHLLIGGLAVIAVGEPRTTADVDVIGYATPSEARALVARAIAAGFEARPEVEQERLAATGTLRLPKGPFHLDVILASLPFEESAYRRALRKKLFGRMVLLPTPEDLLLFKILAGRDKDMLDAVGIARRHFARLDRGYVEAQLREICDAAQDTAAWSRLERVLRDAAPPASG